MFVTFEGIEGSGKTTQSARLVRSLAARGLAVLGTREPGGTPVVGAALRGILLHPGNAHLDPRAELFIYLADRAQHVSEVLRPALARGEIVVCDRYGDSTEAYQGAGRALGAEEARRLHAIACGGLEPDLTFLLDLDPAEGLRRAGERLERERASATEGRFEEESLEFHARVRAGYRAIAGREPRRVKMLDAAADPDAVAARIAAHFDEAWAAWHEGKR